jgi:hypothetical protein
MSYVMMYNIYDLAMFGCNTGVIYTRTLKNTRHTKKCNERVKLQITCRGSSWSVFLTVVKGVK